MRHISVLPQVDILCSERADGDFRGQPTVAQHLPKYDGHTLAFTHLHLEHGDVVVQPSANESIAEADAAVIIRDNQGLSMVVGDCFPIILADQDARVLALIHGGWRSLAAGIVQKTLTTMKLCGATTPALQVWIGPGARSCCYRSADVPAQISEHDWHSVIEKVIVIEQEKNSSKVEWQIDLPKYISQVLVQNGVQKNQIFDEQSCTVCHPQQYYSHQRSKLTGDTDGRFLVAAYWHFSSTVQAE